MTQKPDEQSVAAEAIIVFGMAIIVGACFFEWLVISPDHPGYALLRVLAASLVATLVTTLLPVE